MAKRERLEILKDIMEIIQKNNNKIKPTPLMRHSNLSSKRFSEYIGELLDKEFVIKTQTKKRASRISLTEKGFRYLEKYKTIVNFIEEFEL